jgi:hypothetical protein
MYHPGCTLYSSTPTGTSCTTYHRFPIPLCGIKVTSTSCSWYDPGMTMFHQLPQPGGKPLMSLPRIPYPEHPQFPRVEGGLACPLLDRPMDIRLDVQSPDKPPQAPGTGNCSRRRHCWSMLRIWGNRRPWTVLVRYQRTLGLTKRSCPRDCRHESPYTMFFVGATNRLGIIMGLEPVADVCRLRDHRSIPAND